MPIGTILPVAPVVPANRVATTLQSTPQKPDVQPVKQRPLEPTPALRPTIQDKIDFTRTLIALRSL